MEIDITRFCKENDPADYSASVAEIGDNASKITWNAAMRESAHAPLLTTPAQIDALREYVKGFGAWSDEEIAAWSDTECNALFVQLVSGDLREGGLETFSEDEWIDYSERSANGQASSNLFRDSEGRVYYCLEG
jgi:hypothetical protein